MVAGSDDKIKRKTEIELQFLAMGNALNYVSANTFDIYRYYGEIQSIIDERDRKLEKLSRGGVLESEKEEIRKKAREDVKKVCQKYFPDKNWKLSEIDPMLQQQKDVILTKGKIYQAWEYANTDKQETFDYRSCQIMYSNDDINETDKSEIESGEKIMLQIKEEANGQTTYILHTVDENENYIRKKITEQKDINKIKLLANKTNLKNRPAVVQYETLDGRPCQTFYSNGMCQGK